MATQYIQFKIGEDDYASEMSLVREIIKPIKVKKLLGAPDFVKGVAKIREDIIAIIQLHKKFSIQPVINLEEHGRIIILEIEGEKLGLWVDDVVEILESEIKEKLPSIIHHGLITEILKMETIIIPILDVKQLFSSDVSEWLNDGMITPNENIKEWQETEND